MAEAPLGPLPLLNSTPRGSNSEPRWLYSLVGDPYNGCRVPNSNLGMLCRNRDALCMERLALNSARDAPHSESDMSCTAALHLYIMLPGTYGARPPPRHRTRSPSASQLKPATAIPDPQRALNRRPSQTFGWRGSWMLPLRMPLMDGTFTTSALKADPWAKTGHSSRSVLMSSAHESPAGSGERSLFCCRNHPVAFAQMRILQRNEHLITHL